MKIQNLIFPMIIFPLIVLAALLITSCQSPMDLNTPKIIIDPPLHPVIAELNIEENGRITTFNVDTGYVTINTSVDPPIISMNCNFITPEIIGDYYRIGVTGIKFNIDSLQMSGEKFPLNTVDYKGSSIAFVWQYGINYKRDTVLWSGQRLNQIYNNTDVAFVLNKSKKEVWAYVHSNIYDFKIYKDVIKKDTTIYKTVYDTIWVDSTHTNYSGIDQRLDSTKITNSIENFIWTPDSLFLDGKFRFTY